MSQTTEFLPQLQQLRTIYTDFIELDEMDFDAFRKAVDFYYTHRDVGQFEKMMLDILFEKDKQTLAIVILSLKNELDKILEIMPFIKSIKSAMRLQKDTTSIPLPACATCLRRFKILSGNICPLK